MKDQNLKNKLAFTKAVVTELNDYQMFAVNGGSSTGCVCDAVADAIAEITKDFTRPLINQL